MRRYDPPFNGKRYLLNKNTGEIHDLDNETDACRIDDMDPEHVLNCRDYDDAFLRAHFLRLKNPNGCHYCNRSRDNG